MHACVCGAVNTTSRHELRDHFRSQSFPGLLRIRQEEVDAGNTFFDVDEGLVVEVVRHEVGLDEAGGPIVDEDQIQGQVGSLPSIAGR